MIVTKMGFHILPVVFFWSATLVVCLESQKLSRTLQAKMEKGGTANIFISFGSTAATLAATKLQRSRGNPTDKAQSVRSSLLNLANAEQAGVFNMLQAQRSSMKFEKMWLSNLLYIKNANYALVKQIVSMSNVTSIAQEESVSIADTVIEPRDGVGPDNGPKDYTYEVNIIQAPEAWQVLGGPEKAGEGVIVGICDSRCNVEHEALKDNFNGGEYGYFAPDQDVEMETPAIT